MLIPCLWTSLPLIVLGQTYYMSFIFNNYGTSRISAPQLGFEGTSNHKMDGGNPEIKSREHSREEETLEVSSLEHSRESKKISNSKKRREQQTLELSSEDHSQENHHNSKSDENKDSTDSDETLRWSTTSKVKTTALKRKTKTTTNETPEMPTEITTESTKVTEKVKEKAEDMSRKLPEELYTENPQETKETLNTDLLEATTDQQQNPDEVVVPARTWESVTPHPSEFFDYPLATCHEDMDLHEVFGIRLERDRGLPSKVLCNFQNSWGGPWLLMTRIELPVRIHLRHWYFGYITPDYKDVNINFLALAHIMNSMRTAMLIIGQDKNNKLVYNLYDDVVISAFNDLFMLRKAELVAANTTELLFVSVGKVMSTFAGRNRSCPLQVLGSWWGHNAVHEMYEGFFCSFPTDRNISVPGYVAIFIKPSLFPTNHTALYNHPISTRRPWKTNYRTDALNGTLKNPPNKKRNQASDWDRNKLAVHKELARRVRIFATIDRLRMEEGMRHRGIT